MLKYGKIYTRGDIMIKIWKYIILIFILIWTIFVVVDSVRLKQSNNYTTPLIKISQQVDFHEVTYVGVGYTITYRQEKNVEIDGDAIGMGYGNLITEFKLFGKIMLWKKSK